MKIAFQPSKQLRVRDVDAEHLAQARKIGGVVDLAELVVPQRLVGSEARGDIGGLAFAMTRPARHRPLEVDVEHDAAEIEQQRVGGAGGEGRGHGGDVRKLAQASNHRNLAQQTRLRRRRMTIPDVGVGARRENRM